MKAAKKATQIRRQPDRPFETLLRRLDSKISEGLAHAAVPTSDAEDLLQETLFALAFKWDTIRNPEAWLLSTLQNRCAIYWRKRNEGRLEAVDAAILEALAGPQDPGQRQAELRHDLNLALGRLPERHRNVLKLRFGLGCKSSEIAEALGYESEGMRKLSHESLASLTRELTMRDLPSPQLADSAPSWEFRLASFLANYDFQASNRWVNDRLVHDLPQEIDQSIDDQRHHGLYPTGRRHTGQGRREPKRLDLQLPTFPAVSGAARNRLSSEILQSSRIAPTLKPRRPRIIHDRSIRTGLFVFALAELLIPRRLAREEIGDALETIDVLVKAGAATWRIYVKVISTVVWLIVNVVRELTSALTGKKDT